MITKKLITGIIKRLSSLFIIFLLSNITISCQRTKNSYPLTIHVDFSQAIHLFNSEIFKNIRIVELETNVESTLGQINEVAIWDNNIFIFDKNNTNTVLRFHSNGKFLNTYGNIGKGPKEYTNAKSFIIDKNNSQIELLVRPGKTLIYNLLGDYIDQFSYPVQLPALSFSKDNRGNYYYYCGHNSGFDEHRLFLLNEQGKIIKRYFNDKSSLVPFEEPNNNFLMHGDTMFFREAFNNCLYIIIDDKAIPYYCLNFYEYNLPQDIPQDFFISLEKYASLFSFYRNSEFELSTIIKHERNNTPAFFSILKNITSGNTIVIELPELSTFIDSFVFPLYLTEENEVVFSVHPMDLVLNSDVIKNSPVFHSIIDEIHNIDEATNPFLIFGKLKTF